MLNQFAWFWFLSFILTLTIEASVLMFLLRRPTFYVVTVTLLINAFTQPLATILVKLSPQSFWFVEAGVIITEAVLLVWALSCSYRRAAMLSLVANSLTIILAVGWAQYLYPVQTTYQAIQPCFTPMSESTPEHCIEEVITLQANIHPETIPSTTTALWRLFQHDYIIGDARVFSPLAHHTAAVWLQYRQDPVAALRECSAAWLGACRHGVVMMYIQAQPQRYTPEEWLQWCSEVVHPWQHWLLTDVYRDCVHGVGHALVLRVPKHSTIETMLGYCLALPTQAEQSACGSGVFMEYSLKTLSDHQGTEHHHHMDVIAINTYIELPCTKLSEHWQPLCYASAGSYRQYVPGQETFAESYQWCKYAAGPYHVDCQHGVEQRYLLVNP